MVYSVQSDTVCSQHFIKPFRAATISLLVDSLISCQQYIYFHQLFWWLINCFESIPHSSLLNMIFLFFGLFSLYIKLNIYTQWTIKEGIWCLLGIWKTVMDIFHNFKDQIKKIIDNEYSCELQPSNPCSSAWHAVTL